MFNSRQLKALVLLILFLTVVEPTESHAYLSAIIPAAAIGAAILVTTSATLYRPSASVPPPYWPPGGGIVTSAGRVGRVLVGAQVAWTNYGQTVLRGNYVAAVATIAALQSKLVQGGALLQDKFAGLSSWLLKGGSAPAATIDSPMGSIVTGSNGLPVVLGPWNWTIGRFENGTAPLPESRPGLFNGQPVIFAAPVYDAPYWYYSRRSDITGTPAVLPPQPKTSAEVYSSLGSGSTPPPSALSDIDRMIEESVSDYGISIVDAPQPSAIDSASPVVWPAVPPSSVDQDLPLITGLNSPAIVAAKSGAANSQALLTQAQSALNQYMQANPLATPDTDPQLKDLQAAAADAQDVADASRAAYTDALQQSAESYPNASPEPLKKLNFDSLRSLSGAVSSVFPFTLISGLSEMYSRLTAEPSPPVFDLPMPLGNSIRIDLASWDSVARIMRYFVALLTSVGVVFYIVRFYRGVS